MQGVVNEQKQSSLIPTLRWENFADVPTKYFSHHQGNDDQSFRRNVCQVFQSQRTLFQESTEKHPKSRLLTRHISQQAVRIVKCCQAHFCNSLHAGLPHLCLALVLNELLPGLDQLLPLQSCSVVLAGMMLVLLYCSIHVCCLFHLWACQQGWACQ